MTAYSGLQNRIAREAQEDLWLTHQYADTPPGRVTRQMRRAVEREQAKADLAARKKAFKGKGGKAVVR